MKTDSNKKPNKQVPKTFVDGVVVDCNLLNVRKRPSIVSDVVVIISNGTPLTVEDSYKNEHWYKITTATGDHGFVMKDFVAIKE